MPSLSLYRKYRPQNFNEIIGQPAVTKTLLNALENDRISHAYLFAGPRGTGKTSTAKVLAMAVNCEDESTYEPCGECNSCKRIKSGNSIDVIEIDAASNRGIDEIRELREKVKFYPGEGKYKVYIIDEVHMLTTGAFNALLKTLEEPPKNVIFVLATTEPHKVIPTIMSRCQRFDFSLISEKEIENHLEYIAKKEKLDFEIPALNLIARSSEGGLRDALSILDQAISFAGEDIKTEVIEEMLGKTSGDVLKELLLSIKNNNTGQAISLINDILNEGKDVSRLIEDLKEYCNQLLLIKELGIKTNLIKLPKERLQEMQKLSKEFTIQQMTNTVDVLNGINNEIFMGGNSRINLEVGIFKIAKEIKEIDLQEEVKDLKIKMKQLEEKLENGSFNTNKNIQINSQTLNKEDKDKTDQEKNKKVKDTETNKDTKHVKETELNINEVKKYWPIILGKLKEKDISMYAILVEAEPAEVQGKKIYISFPEDKNFHRKRAKEKKDFIGKFFSRQFSMNCQINIASSSDKVEDKQSKDYNSNNNTDTEKQVKQNNTGEVSIEDVAKMFNGEIIETDPDVISNK